MFSSMIQNLLSTSGQSNAMQRAVQMRNQINTINSQREPVNNTAINMPTSVGDKKIEPFEKVLQAGAKVKFGDGIEKEFLAKLDTGNSTAASVLEVGEYTEEGNKVKFTVDGKQMEFEKIKVSKAVAGEETYERPVIEIPELTVGLRKLKNVHIAIVKDRDKKTTNFLLNRDAMSKLGYVVNPNTAHILTKEMQKVKII